MKVLFIDRDGTLIHEPIGGYIDSLEKLKIEPHIIESLQKLQSKGYKFVMISNQPGRGTKKFPEINFITPQNKLMEIFAKNNITFEETFFCPHFREDNCNCMKPKTGLVDEYIKNNNINLKKSYTIGDRESDMQLAKNIGCKSISYSDEIRKGSDFNSKNWKLVAEYIIKPQ